MEKRGYTYGGFYGFMGNFVGNLGGLWINYEEKRSKSKKKTMEE